MEKRGVSRKSISLKNVERVETVDCVRSPAEEVAAQYVKHSLDMKHSLDRNIHSTETFTRLESSVLAM